MGLGSREESRAGAAKRELLAAPRASWPARCPRGVSMAFLRRIRTRAPFFHGSAFIGWCRWRASVVGGGGRASGAKPFGSCSFWRKPQRGTTFFPPPSAAWLQSLELPEGAVAAGRGRGRVGVEPRAGEGEMGVVCLGLSAERGCPDRLCHRLLSWKPLPEGRAHTRSARRLSRRWRREAGSAVLRVWMKLTGGTFPSPYFFAHLARWGLRSERKAWVPTEQELPFLFVVSLIGCWCREVISLLGWRLRSLVLGALLAPRGLTRLSGWRKTRQHVGQPCSWFQRELLGKRNSHLAVRSTLSNAPEPAPSFSPKTWSQDTREYTCD